ncbi:Glycoside hydrolase, superfamily [Cynara cardunculus var. scolymus]|uniref:Glycoside hydrolase, superfamily n=1 Tax=Cynara cardunculus var. scolymus TaxID=59895 RepID=A0A103MLL5_CYNCS|nr:Glycoside hydrolase, superfamily [Cynara cardunculus var. scolymus]
MFYMTQLVGGQLITILKKSQTIKFASIAPYEDNGPLQSHYLALWKKYGYVIDYVYAYDKLSVSPFIYHFNHQQDSSYVGCQLLASFISKGNLDLPPNDGFFEACRELKRQGKLGGIFVWSLMNQKPLVLNMNKNLRLWL